MINYTWNIIRLDCAPSENGLTNVVKIIYWGLTGTDENGVSASMSNSYPLPSPTPEGFTDYSTLTEETVIGWLENSLDVGYLRTKLANEIVSQYNPPITSLPFPWIKVEEPVVVEEFVVEESVIEEPAVTEEPVVEEPAVTEEPVIEEPAVTEEPVVEESVVEESVVEEPAVTEEPVVEEPAVTEEPVVEEVVVEEPVVEEPAVTEEPVVVEEFVVEESVIEEPAVTEEPVVEEVVAD